MSQKRERAEAWSVAIGLQAVDGLKVSDYLLELARRNMEGEIRWRVPVGNSGNWEVLVSKIITLSIPISWIFYTFVADFTYSTQGVPKV